MGSVASHLHTRDRKIPMTRIASLGIDLAKNVFALHGVDEAGKPVLVRPNVALGVA